jgi:hypothetical protein
MLQQEENGHFGFAERAHWEKVARMAPGSNRPVYL